MDTDNILQVKKHARRAVVETLYDSRFAEKVTMREARVFADKVADGIEAFLSEKPATK